MSFPRGTFPPSSHPFSSVTRSRSDLNRLAHRLRDMQTLPYVVLRNQHLAHVYELYYKAFERFRRVHEVQTLDDNDRFCKILKETLREHLTVIPRLTIGVLEVQGSMKPEQTDNFMNTLLRSVSRTQFYQCFETDYKQRISRRVIAEQHLALTETFHSPWHFPDAKIPHDPNADSVGEIFLRCNAKETVEKCAEATRSLMQKEYGPSHQIPDIKIDGHLDATFPYILSHLEYIIGELLRNSIQAVIEQRQTKDAKPPPIEILICETSQHVIIRISDQGGGIPREMIPYVWSFSKGPRKKMRLKNLHRVPKMAATMQEVRADHADAGKHFSKNYNSHIGVDSSLSSLTSRPPNLRLGIGMPMSRIYAEYWAGSLEVHSLEGYGTDAFLQISKLGNKNEQLTSRASMDAV